ncbi:uncharacterized protein LOC126597634 [Malus sylvestris]|uniref:uncharacterized protein LOC126597634 n=1 Tax=Malus sylvestris TaxID=3752 RepID=UPI0021ACA821|nr:uncharacterized protein LOC126597634 [Malus sylvestris]
MDTSLWTRELLETSFNTCIRSQLSYPQLSSLSSSLYHRPEHHHQHVIAFSVSTTTTSLSTLFSHTTSPSLSLGVLAAQDPRRVAMDFGKTSVEFASGDTQTHLESILEAAEPHQAPFVKFEADSTSAPPNLILVSGRKLRPCRPFSGQFLPP